MDELQLVRELFDERPPPRPEVIAAARARLTGPGPQRDRPPQRWRNKRVVLGAGIPVAAAATAAVVLAATGLPAPAAKPGPGAAARPAGADVSGQKILRAVALAAARNAPAGPPGHYWVTPSATGNFLSVGPVKDRYLLLERGAVQDWTSGNGRRITIEIRQSTGAQPVSAADRQAWRRDGSPRSWNDSIEAGLADVDGTAPGRATRIPAGRGAMFIGETDNGQQFTVGTQPYTAHGLLGLPTDPAQLKVLLKTGYLRDRWGPLTAYLFWRTALVLTMPVTPQIRAGLYRLLAGLPGVQGLGQVTDAAGQTGEAVAISGRQAPCARSDAMWSGKPALSFAYPSCTIQQSLIIDPATGALLAQEMRYTKLPPGKSWPGPGGLFSFQVFGESRWSNAKPPLRPGYKLTPEKNAPRPVN